MRERAGVLSILFKVIAALNHIGGGVAELAHKDPNRQKHRRSSISLFPTVDPQVRKAGWMAGSRQGACVLIIEYQ